MMAGSHDPFLLVGDARCHQLYKPPGYTTGGLLLSFSCSGELIPCGSSTSTVGSSPFLGWLAQVVRARPILAFRVLHWSQPNHPRPSRGRSAAPNQGEIVTCVDYVEMCK